MTDEAISPLRRRMIEDMTIRKFARGAGHTALCIKVLAGIAARRYSMLPSATRLPTAIRSTKSALD